jgi:hypothetical protein
VANPRPVVELVVDIVALGGVLLREYLFSIRIILSVLHTNSFFSHQWYVSVATDSILKYSVIV